MREQDRKGTLAQRRDIGGRLGATPGRAAVAHTPAGAQEVERVRTRAYEIYQARSHNGGTGDAQSDWLEAEREVNGETPRAASVTETMPMARGDALLASRND